jgi:hypothetical protein
MSFFIASRCWAGFKQARMLSEMINGPRYDQLACPSCKAAPPTGEFWLCGTCRTKYDIFSQQGACPRCQQVSREAPCPHCNRRHPFLGWYYSEMAQNAEG